MTVSIRSGRAVDAHGEDQGWVETIRIPHSRRERKVLMAGETIIAVVGNLTADPELRSTKNGRSVAGFTIASTPRTFEPAVAAVGRWGRVVSPLHGVG